jgi:hypothetical protein
VDILMTTRVDEYRERLRRLPPSEWDEFLVAESGLPGPRGNLELANAVADEGDPVHFHQWAAISADDAPPNDPGEFLAFCGVLGLGETAARGDDSLLPRLRGYANDPRWRVREAVAMGLQRIGDRGLGRLRDAVSSWADGSWLERRAAAAGVCEPRLLADPEHAVWVLHLLDRITGSLGGAPDRRDPGFRALRKGLGYCWSVAVVAAPEPGRRLLEQWANSDDPDIRWVVRENLKKKRLERLDGDWVASLRAQVNP